MNNAAKICSYGLNILENIEVKHVFQCKACNTLLSKTLLSNTFHTMRPSTFNLVDNFEKIDNIRQVLNMVLVFCRLWDNLNKFVNVKVILLKNLKDNSFKKFNWKSVRHPIFKTPIDEK